MAEDLTEYFHENGIRVRYLHSDIDTLERIEIMRDLRLGVFDVLVGINLLREGLDIPECAHSGISSPSLKRLIPTKTSKTPSLKSLMISIRSNVSISECKYLTLIPFSWKYSVKSSAIFLVKVVTKTLKFLSIVFLQKNNR